MKRLWIVLALITLFFSIGPPLAAATTNGMNNVGVTRTQTFAATSPSVAPGGATTNTDWAGTSTSTYIGGFPGLVTSSPNATDNQTATHQQPFLATNDKRGARASKKSRSHRHLEGRHRLTATRNATQLGIDDPYTATNSEATSARPLRE